MTELKTLKDINIFPEKMMDESEQKEIIRAEAVKWMKAFGIDTTIEEKRDSKEFIRNFFNLTEEDLK